MCCPCNSFGGSVSSVGNLAGTDLQAVHPVINLVEVGHWVAKAAYISYLRRTSIRVAQVHTLL